MLENDLELLGVLSVQALLRDAAKHVRIAECVIRNVGRLRRRDDLRENVELRDRFPMARVFACVPSQRAVKLAAARPEISPT